MKQLVGRRERETAALRIIANCSLHQLDGLADPDRLAGLRSLAKRESAFAALLEALDAERVYSLEHPDLAYEHWLGGQAMTPEWRSLRHALKGYLNAAAPIAEEWLASVPVPKVQPQGPRFSLAQRSSDLLVRLPWVRGVALFGSVVRCEDKADSDIDLWLQIDPRLRRSHERQLMSAIVRTLSVAQPPAELMVESQSVLWQGERLQIVAGTGAPVGKGHDGAYMWLQSLDSLHATFVRHMSHPMAVLALRRRTDQGVLLLPTHGSKTLPLGKTTFIGEVGWQGADGFQICSLTIAVDHQQEADGVHDTSWSADPIIPKNLRVSLPDWYEELIRDALWKLDRPGS